MGDEILQNQHDRYPEMTHSDWCARFNEDHYHVGLSLRIETDELLSSALLAEVMQSGRHNPGSEVQDFCARSTRL